MAFLNRAFVVFVLCSVLGEWISVAATSGTSTIHIVPSPTVLKSSTSNSTKSHNTTTIASHNMTVTTKNMTVTPSHNKTVMPQNMTVTPSHNKTVMPHNMTVTPSHNKTVMPHNMTVTPSHNKTVMPHNMTVTPSHNKTVMPHNMTVTPSHNKTVMPHNMTVTPSHNKTVAPHNMTVTPSHNMTVMPHNSTVMPHNMTITPSSAHTVIPTSSVHPAPAPQPGNFTLQENNTVCLFAYMAAKFDITVASKKLSIELPTNATTSGKCDKNAREPYITLKWQTKDGHSCNFTVHFVKFVPASLTASSKQKWAAANVTFSLKMKSGVAEPIYRFHSGKRPLEQLSADVGYGFDCRTESIRFNLTANNSIVDLTLTNIDFKPFSVKNGEFGNEVTKCGASSTTAPYPKTTPTSTKKSDSHVVAIAVGCSLAGLVVIVGIGYMIGRRRNRNQSAGYRKL